MTLDLQFDVRGRPRPQGSMSRGANGGLFHSNRKVLEAWRGDILEAAQRELGDLPAVRGPVAVQLVFRLARPQNHFLPANGRRPAPVLRPDAPADPATKPDIDKLARAALDALTSAVFADDAQVARLVATKRWCDPGDWPGVAISVRSLEETR